MGYDILTHHTSRDMVNDVAIHIEQGWRPLGNVSLTSNPTWEADNHRYYFAQVIIKDDDHE